MRSIILVFLAMLITAESQGQRHLMYSKRIACTVYLNNGDSIEGNMKPRGEYKGSIKIKTAKGRKRIDIDNIEKLKLNILQYRTVQISGRQYLLEEVAYGKYSLFAYDKKSDNRNRRYFYLAIPGEDAKLIVPENFQEICEEYLYSDPYVREKLVSGEWLYADVLNAFRVFNYRHQKEKEEN